MGSGRQEFRLSSRGRGLRRKWKRSTGGRRTNQQQAAGWQHRTKMPAKRRDRYRDKDRNREHRDREPRRRDRERRSDRGIRDREIRDRENRDRENRDRDRENRARENRDRNTLRKIRGEERRKVRAGPQE